MSSDTTNSKGSQVGLIALVVGIVGIVIALFGFKQGWDTGEVRPIMSWLIALGFWLSIAIGMLFLVQIWYVFHARWPTIIRRQCEHFMAAFPYLLVLFLPLLAIPFLTKTLVFSGSGWMGIMNCLVTALWLRTRFTLGSRHF
jgi:hypothetical protein